MARWLKRGLEQAERRDIDIAVRQTVQPVIRQIEADGRRALGRRSRPCSPSLSPWSFRPRLACRYGDDVRS